MHSQGERERGEMEVAGDKAAARAAEAVAKADAALAQAKVRPGGGGAVSAHCHCTSPTLVNTYVSHPGARHPA